MPCVNPSAGANAGPHITRAPRRAPHHQPTRSRIMPNPVPAFLPRVRTVAHAAIALARDRLRIIDGATRRPAQPPSASVRAHTTDGTGTVEALYRELPAHRARESRMQLGALLDHP